MPSPDRYSTIVLEGRLGLRDAKGLQQRLLDAFGQFEAITIDVRSLEQADTSLLQLLIAARKKATAQGNQLTLLAEPRGALETLLSRVGLLGATGECRREDDQFWLGTAAPAGGVAK